MLLLICVSTHLSKRISWKPGKDCIVRLLPFKQNETYLTEFDQLITNRCAVDKKMLQHDWIIFNPNVSHNFNQKSNFAEMNFHDNKYNFIIEERFLHYDWKLNLYIIGNRIFEIEQTLPKRQTSNLSLKTCSTRYTTRLLRIWGI